MSRYTGITSSCDINKMKYWYCVKNTSPGGSEEQLVASCIVNKKLLNVVYVDIK